MVAENSYPSNAASALPAATSISAIVPARDEEAVIAACLRSLIAQPEISEIIVVDDQSTDRTARIVRDIAAREPRVRLVQTGPLPAEWVGKNHAAWTGAQQARSAWLLFTDADAEFAPDAARLALDAAEQHQAALVSISPEQLMATWYENALIPFIYCRLARHFSYDQVNDPKSPAAAANGQFLMVRREVYEAIGGHAAVAGDLLEDVALARLVKKAGHALWFAAGKGVVRVRMYRSFRALWQGWKKNLYRLVGGTPRLGLEEMLSAVPWIALLVILAGIVRPVMTLLGVLLLILRQAAYGSELKRNQFHPRLILYYVPAFTLYAAVLWASYRGYAKGKVSWKGRDVAVGLAAR
jgi:glycosyltransferase involved in cell wall biosynthesis